MTTTLSHPRSRVITHVGDLVEPELTEEQQQTRMREFILSLAEQRFRGATITPDTRMNELPGGQLLTGYPLGAVALLACPGGPYADPTATDLFDAFVRVYDQRDKLPPQLRLAAQIGEWFTGSVREMTELVDAVLTEPQH